MIKHRFYRFTDRLIEAILNDFQADNTVFVFPTERSKKEALRVIQKRWDFSDALFLTMEEFKESLFVDELLLLREEKRNIALYQSLNSDQKGQLKIENYFRFIGFAADFFSFWEELAEEEITPEHCSELFTGNSDEIPEWQDTLLKTISELRLSYREYLTQRDWTDRIFLNSSEKITDEFYRGYRRFVFVNQLYYTKLENRLLEHLAGKGYEVSVCYQIDESFVDKKANCLIGDLSVPLNDLRDRLTEKIEIYLTQNDFSMYLKLLELLTDNPNLKDIFDNRFYQSSYPRFFSPSAFTGIDKEPVLKCSSGVFLECLTELLESILLENSKQRELIPIEILVKVFSERAFFSYFETDLSRQEIVLRLLNDYLRKSRRYIDTGLRFFALEDEKTFGEDKERKKEEIFLIKSLLQRVIDFLDVLSKIESISDFVESIDSDRGLDLSHIISDEEKKFSDIPDVIYSSLADFSQIEDFGMIDHSRFWQEGRTYNRFTVISGIIKLFLLYLRPKKFKRSYPRKAGLKNIGSLMDSRNLMFDTVAVLNASEGVLPTGRSTPFLFTEDQRKRLGLKTYEDIRCWEKYYFFRLILNSRHAFLFAMRNDSQNTEISSFIEELKLLFANDETLTIDEKEIDDTGYNAFYRLNTAPDESFEPDKNQMKETSFYALPLNREDDFTGNELALTYSSYKVLRDSPFSYYLKYIAGIEEVQTYTPFSPMLTGSIAHYLIEKIWRIVQIPDDEDLTEFFENLPAKAAGLLHPIRKLFFESDEFYFMIPHTYSFRYFVEIFLPIIEEGIIQMFSSLKDILIHKNSLLQLEYERSSPQSPVPFNVLRAEPSEEDVDPSKDTGLPEVFLSGRADLLIKEFDKRSGEEKLRIIDYKTGNLNSKKELVTQLVIYELAFCHLKNILDLSGVDKGSICLATDQVSSYVYSLSDQKIKELAEFHTRKSKEDLIRGFLDNLKGLLAAVVDKGWIGTGHKPQYVLFPEIVRTDLLKKYVRTLIEAETYRESSQI